MNHLTLRRAALVAATCLCAVPAIGHEGMDEMAHAALDRLDARRPLPLLPMMADHQKQNMRGHLVAVQEIVAALSTDDFDAIVVAATRIGYSEETGQMCTHMGAATHGFTEQALAFHHSADDIAKAARERNRARVVSTLAVTLGHCTGCHATWKQQVVDETSWRRLTSADHPLPAQEPSAR
jgi:hypothetical protein